MAKTKQNKTPRSKPNLYCTNLTCVYMYVWISQRVTQYNTEQFSDYHYTKLTFCRLSLHKTDFL